jgi:hypothetical protein
MRTMHTPLSSADHPFSTSRFLSSSFTLSAPEPSRGKGRIPKKGVF